MRRYEAESIGDILRQAIEESQNSKRFAEISAINAWPSVIGRELAGRTLRPTVKAGVMTIQVPSAPLRQELNMMRTSLAAALNAAVGKDVISELKFI